jgi:hypothetical protein
LFHSLNTVANLLSELALSVAAAQSQLDADYVRNLKDYLLMVSELQQQSAATAPGITPPELLTLLQATAPTRHQFTETTVEVRADLQMSTLSELGVSGEFGGRAGIFAVAVNAAYTRRSAYDHRAAATIRAVIHSVPASPGVMEKLLSAAAGSSTPALPSSARYRELRETFGALQKVLSGRPSQPDAATASAATSVPAVTTPAGPATAVEPLSNTGAGPTLESPTVEPADDQPPQRTDSPAEAN